MKSVFETAQEPKLEWNQPKLVELDANKTEGGFITTTSESQINGAMS